MKLTSLTTDERVLRLEYRYIPEGQTKTEKQFRKLFQDPEKLHRNGYVHSDIREEDLVFGEKEDEAWMIDFDPADREGTYYPITYNGKLPCRHPSAQPHERREKKHDTHSLGYILQRNFASVQVKVKVDVDNYTFTLV